MKSTPQQRAVRNYRKRLSGRGLARFEVLGLSSDRELIRSIARRLADKGADSDRIRQAVSAAPEDLFQKGGLYRALRRSPLVGADLQIARPIVPDRPISL